MRIPISKKMSMIDSSGIRKVFNLAAKMDNPVNLSIGQPDFDIPEEVKESAVKAIINGRNKYTLTQGIEELNRKLLRYYQDLYPQHKPESIMITSGVSGGILLAFMAMIDPGDEILIPDPYFVMYKHLINLLGGVPVTYNLYPDFRITEKAIKPGITKKTKMIIINSPNNPTGMVHSREEIKLVHDIAREHDLFIVSDEIYDTYVYNNGFTSILEFTDQAMVLKGFSKNFSATGWRVGFALAPDRIIQEMIKLQQYTFVCAPAPFQYAILENLDYDFRKIREEYAVKRDTIYNALKEKFKVAKPEGAFYMFPEAPDKKASLFTEKAIKNNLLIIPGNVFSEQDTNFRISFAAPLETLRKGGEILNSLV
ncbi:MAG: aminotransferase class I/II-fold pyridoxal phosphate-dependent enzyme [bacterium]|nr:aminotransferase class I/II-fold pyridoxal phosphate-dependent enzyme [bacterium]